MPEAKILDKLKAFARKLKQELFVLFLASKDDRVPWYAKLVSFLVVTYAFSPIDLIPDFIPILGYLDDIILIPLGISLALKMIPQPIIDDLRIKANEIREKGNPKNWVTGIIFIIIWILLAYWLGSIIYKLIQ
ncbi:protein of unknown function DUF1232 [Desulfosporosinus sp. I2]|uniref:YkvA family protein n=1 Tax=Desulfosporosinus sp. I2 TaxID=1617025 RepID=UPI00061DF24B|nr:YkvA family protein [Desulfosporosinus sp. I2]KJR45142.1 protein of unknown function DUF1232 [Desulfosporosinus sp. I2]